MKLELNLMELNSLYVAVSNQLKQAQKDAINFPSEFFDSELVRVNELVDKVQDALYAECKAVDEAVDSFRLKPGPIQFTKLEDLEMEFDVLEDERNYYASIGDWDRCEFINDRIDEIKEEIKELK